MIGKGGSRKKGAFFAWHLTNEKDNEKVDLLEARGFDCDPATERMQDIVKRAVHDMKLIAEPTRCENYLYHGILSPSPGERLTDGQWSMAVDTLERHLGLEGQPRVVIKHLKHGEEHVHVLWQRVDVDTMTARPDSLTYPKHEAAAREIERQLGLKPVESVLVKNRERPRPRRRPKDFEGFRGSQTGLNPYDVRGDVMAAWRECDTGMAFRAALEAKGYVLCRGDRRDFCVVDPAGDDHSLARGLVGVKAAEIRERLHDIDRSALPSVEEGRELAHAWGGSEAARSVRLKGLDDKLKAVRDAPKEAELSAWWRDQAYFLQRMGREGFEYQPTYSMLEKAAKQYGVGVKDVAHAAQDAYWQAFIGGMPRSEADKLHDLMWNDSKEHDDGAGWDR